MKYSNFVEMEYGDHIGSIDVLGQTVQLCDHMQNIDNQYFATSFILSVTDRAVLKSQGARFGTLSDGSHAVYLTQDLIKIATPLRDGDKMTLAMITRMSNGLASANIKKHQTFA